MSGFDAAELLEVFLAEADELLAAVDQALVALEQNPSDRQALDAIFRAAHTLKASAAATGFDSMSTLAHRMESVLDLVRSGQLEPSPELTDLLLSCVDALREMKDQIAAAGQPSLDPTELIAKLEQIAGGADGQPDAAKPQRAEAPAGGDSAEPNQAPASDSGQDQQSGPAPDAPIRRLALRIAASCQMPAARAWLWLQQIKKLGDIVKTVPSADDIRAGRLDGSLLVVLLKTSASDDELRQAIQKLPELEGFEITEPREADLGEIAVERAGSETPEAQPRVGSATVRVKVAHLDALMRLAGELVLCRARIMRHVSKLPESAPDAAALKSSAEHLSTIVTELREEVMKARMVPLEYTFARFPRVVRDAARREGKKVELVIQGGDTEVDRSIAERIVDPLKHLLRNAVSHGIEPPEERKAAGKPEVGRVLLKAEHIEGNILITVADDGRGIDVEKIRAKAVERGLMQPEQAQAASDRELFELLFMSGFSTADQVTDVSGRGVGLDVVRSEIEDIGGRIEIHSEPGKGTTFQLRLPLTLAIVPALIVSHADELYALPLSAVLRIVKFSREQTSEVGGRLAVNHLGRVLYLLDLGDLVGQPRQRDQLTVVVVRTGSAEIGLIVDEVVGEQEIVIRPLPAFVSRSEAIAGLATIGEGEFVLLLDAAHLAELASATAADQPVPIEK